MKYAEFTYTKPNGEVSQRSILAVAYPRPEEKSYKGYDVSDMGVEEFSEYLTRLNALRQKQKEELDALAAEFDLKHSFRNFLVERITNLSYEDI